MPDPPVGPEEHHWFRVRLDAHAFGLLDDAEESRFQVHAASCAECGDALKSYAANAQRPAPSQVHIPAGILARWDRARKRLRGLQRRMVREHLASCAECRQDLEAVGFRPVLEAEPELEPDADLASPVPAVAPSGHTIRIVRGRPSWAAWLLGGATGVGLATAATLMVVANLPPVTRPVPTGAGTGASPPAAARDRVLEPLALSGELKAALRGPGESVTDIRVDPETRFVHLGVPDLFLPDTTMLRLRVVDPAGRTVEILCRYGDLMPRRTLLFGDPDAALLPGEYRLVVSTPVASGSALGEFQFRLVR